MGATVDVLVPTYARPAALAVTLAGLLGQTFRDFRVVVSDQTDGPAPAAPEALAVVRALRAGGHEVELHRHLPRRGMAEHRQYLLEQVRAPYALFLDDDLILEPFVLEELLLTLQEEGCGFAGSAVIGLSYLDDHRPEEAQVSFWDGPVRPEVVHPGSHQWQRHRLHNAANLFHVQNRLGIRYPRRRTYRVAWIGGCVMYDTDKLRDAGGFDFWRALPPEHAGEDVLAQLRVMARHGGCGVMPSGVYHQELPTTIGNREVDAPLVLPVEP